MSRPENWQWVSSFFFTYETEVVLSTVGICLFIGRAGGKLWGESSLMNRLGLVESWFRLVPSPTQTSYLSLLPLPLTSPFFPLPINCKHVVIFYSYHHQLSSPILFLIHPTPYIYITTPKLNVLKKSKKKHQKGTSVLVIHW